MFYKVPGSGKGENLPGPWPPPSEKGPTLLLMGSAQGLCKNDLQWWNRLKRGTMKGAKAISDSKRGQMGSSALLRPYDSALISRDHHNIDREERYEWRVKTVILHLIHMCFLYFYVHLYSWIRISMYTWNRIGILSNPEFNIVFLCVIQICKNFEVLFYHIVCSLANFYNILQLQPQVLRIRLIS